MFLTACNSQTDSDDTVVQIYTVSKIWYHQTTVDNFNNNCPILLVLVRVNMPSNGDLISHLSCLIKNHDLLLLIKI